MERKEREKRKIRKLKRGEGPQGLYSHSRRSLSDSLSQLYNAHNFASLYPFTGRY
jgi:hypothetical protein